ncbi:MAG: NUDIX domain-containing protein [Polyangiaceae bacterium]|nr:NUDIX domain-containing protein [Polyangiaceae bacterium]
MTSPVLPRVAVVTADNRFLRWADRREVHSFALPHRSVHVLIFNDAGDLLIQRRHTDKLTFGGYWDLSCAGHVEEPDYISGPDDFLDRVYLSVAERELKEELGVSAQLQFLGEFGPEPNVHYECLRLYSGVHNGPFVIQEDEVLEVRFVSPAAFNALSADPNNPLVPGLVWFVAWIRKHTGLFTSGGA